IAKAAAVPQLSKELQRAGFVLAHKAIRIAAEAKLTGYIDIMRRIANPRAQAERTRPHSPIAGGIDAEGQVIAFARESTVTRIKVKTTIAHRHTHKPIVLPAHIEARGDTTLTRLRPRQTARGTLRLTAAVGGRPDLRAA